MQQEHVHEVEPEQQGHLCFTAVSASLMLPTTVACVLMLMSSVLPTLSDSSRVSSWTASATSLQSKYVRDIDKVNIAKKFANPVAVLSWTEKSKL